MGLFLRPLQGLLVREGHSMIYGLKCQHFWSI